MGDKSCYMGAGGYQATTSNGSGYTWEEYAYDSGAPSVGPSTNITSTSQGGCCAPQVFKARTDQSAYMSPN